MVTGFNHSGFVVKDLAKEVAFYRDVIGLEVLRELDSGPEASRHTGIPNARRKLVFMGKRGDGHQLELVQFIEPSSHEGHVRNNVLGAAHVCFNVKGLDKQYDVMKSKGMRFLTPLVVRQAPSGGAIRICYGQDPEGNWLEFIENVP
jgi:catechol 2,3-dioxygenase-like lactoylglutathione lyase family enzyme